MNPAHLECAKPDTADTLAHRRPRRDFPLFAHGNGQWARKVRGSLVYFGKVADDPGGVKALDDWLDRKDELLSGRRRQKTEGATVRELVDQFLTSKRRLVDTGELSARTFEGYRRTCLRVAECPVGGVAMKSIPIDDLRPDDFEALRANFAKAGGKNAVSSVCQMRSDTQKFFLTGPPRNG